MIKKKKGTPINWFFSLYAIFSLEPIKTLIPWNVKKLFKKIHLLKNILFVKLILLFFFLKNIINFKMHKNKKLLELSMKLK